MGTTTRARDQLARRLRPLHVALALQGTLLWVPIEKLFMVEIGFTAVSIGVMAAAYTAVVPLMEVPSGLLADRWSRRGVLAVAAAALMVCTLLGGLSQGVTGYVVSALFLGVHFAMVSGTLDAMVYDTVVEETGSGAGYERAIGRLRLTEAASLAASALAGGVVAELTSLRASYLLTVPFAAAAVVAFGWFREPRLHQGSERVSIIDQVRVTVRTVTGSALVAPLVVVGAAAGAVTQMVFEFGPLWLVWLEAPAGWYGPYWAALTGMLGVGGLLAGRLALRERRTAAAVGVILVAAGVPHALGAGIVLVGIAQVTVVLLLVVVGIHLSQRLHDLVPSSVRAGVASGVGTLGSLVFLPVALTFGWVAERVGPVAAGWMLTGLLAAVALMLVRLAGAPEPTEPTVPGLACEEFVELASDHVDGSLDPATAAAVEAHREICAGCRHYLDQLRDLVRSLALLR